MNRSDAQVKFILKELVHCIDKETVYRLENELKVSEVKLRYLKQENRYKDNL